MKKIRLFIGIAGLMACTGEQPQTTGTAQSVPQATVAEVTPTAQTDTTTVDGTTAATESVRTSSFNGTLEIPPERLATVTLSMGGVVRTLSLLPGSYVAQGTLLATLENPEFIQLQQTYLESRAQLRFLEQGYRGKKHPRHARFLPKSRWNRLRTIW